MNFDNIINAEATKQRVVTRRVFSLSFFKKVIRIIGGWKKALFAHFHWGQRRIVDLSSLSFLWNKNEKQIVLWEGTKVSKLKRLKSEKRTWGKGGGHMLNPDTQTAWSQAAANSRFSKPYPPLPHTIKGHNTESHVPPDGGLHQKKREIYMIFNKTYGE